MRSYWGLILALSAAMALGGITLAKAQNSAPDGRLHIKVSPKQAYVWVDGKAIRDGSQTIKLAPGSHDVTVTNYGYAMQSQNVQIASSKTTDVSVALVKSGDTVAGPFGDIELKGHPRDAVLLNGTTPGYFVGHVDEFDNNWVWHQWLLVKPGTYDLTVTRKGQTTWSGPVNVVAGQRVIVFLNHDGKMETRNFKAGLNMGPQQRFEAKVASAMVDVAPVTADLSAAQAQMTCGQPTTLNWNSANAVDTSITGLGEVPASGDRSVDPKSATTYELTAKGPGGEATRSVTIAVNNKPTATLALSLPQVVYRKVGDKVVEQDATTLEWSASNANHISLQPFGTVADNGSRQIEAQPNQTAVGPVDQNVTYTLTATNACGGTATQTATVHVTGSIEPAPAVTLASVFYPTNYPDAQHPQVGLLPGEEKALADAAATFEKHEQYAQPSQLMVVGYADERGPEKYNMALSQRRAELVKNYLISQGISASDIEIQADGKDHPIDEQTVAQLQSKDPESAPNWMKDQKTTWLAYNRRVDIVMEPTGQQSTEAYPNDAPNARILWQRPQPNLQSIEAPSGASSASAAGTASTGQQTQAGLVGAK